MALTYSSFDNFYMLLYYDIVINREWHQGVSVTEFVDNFPLINYIWMFKKFIVLL